MHKKVLIVDDNETNIAIAEEALGDEFSLRSVLSGEEALCVADQFCPDVVLLDIMMPGMDGYEVSQKLRENQRLRFTKIIFVSARASTEERLEGYEVGGDDYVTKPYDVEELLWKVRVFSRMRAEEEVDWLRNEVLALFSSDSRTPILNVVEPARVLWGKKRMRDGRRRRLGEVICRNTQRLQDFCDRVLRLCEWKFGSRDSIQQTVSLCDVVRAAVATCQKAATEAKVRIEADFQGAPQVRGDGDALRELIEDLLDNAIRFSGKEGRVIVDVHPEGNEACIRVLDGGKGMGPEFAKRAFEPFAAFERQEGGESAEKSEGYGLSLATAREVVLQHGGTISLESEENMQTIVTVRLPLLVEGEGDPT